MISTGTLGDGLRLLAERVPTIIQQSLNPIVSGVEWPTVLKEVDRRKGSPSRGARRLRSE